MLTNGRIQVLRGLFLIGFVSLVILLIPVSGMAAQKTITIDGNMSDWVGVTSVFSDPLGDVNGAGPHDLIKMYITNDDNYIYVRWDAIAALADIKSVTYGLALTSIPAAGSTRPAKEVLLYVDYDSGRRAEVTIASSSSEVILDTEATPYTSTYVRSSESGTTVKTVSIEARFPLSTISSLTTNPVTGDSTIPLWGATLSSGAFTSVVKDYIPDDGYFSYDLGDATYMAVGSGAIAKVSGSTLNAKAAPGATINYILTISNVGTTDNLTFSAITWTLPAGFTYQSGSTTGVTTANPTGTTGTLTWSGLTGSLAPNASTTLNFKATATSTAGTYYSQTTLTTSDGTVNSGDTAVVEISTDYIAPSAPLNLTASNVTEDSVRLTWDAVTGASTYQIYQWGELVATVTAPTVTTVIPGLSPSTAYQYQVVAVSASGVTSGPSNTISVTTSAPADVTPPTVTTSTLTTSNETSSSIQVDWSKGTDNVSAQGSLQYLVYYSTAANIFTVADMEANGTAAGAYLPDISTLNITGLADDTLYYFNVIVKDEAGNKTAYTITNDRTLALGTATLSSNDTTATGTTLSWTAVSGATSYTVYLEDGTPVGTVAAGTTTLDITGLTGNTSYTYYVVATDGTNTTTSDLLTVTTLETTPPTLPADPSLTTSNETTSSIQLDWAKATDNVSAQGALQYLVYYSTSNNIDTVANIEANGTTFGTYTTDIDTMTVTGLTSGTTYYFNVIVIDEAGNKTAYTGASDSTLSLETPTLSSGDTTATGTTLSWSTVPDATSYSVYLEDGTLVGTVTAPTTWLDITGLTQGTSYIYYVVATDGTNTTESNYVEVNTSDAEGPSATPLVLTTSYETTSSIQLDWAKATDNVSAQVDLQYLVYYSTTNNIDTVANIEANGMAFGTYSTDIGTMTVIDLNDGTLYYFNVIVMDEAGNKTAYTMTSDITMPLAPPILSSSDTTATGTTLSWAMIPGATSYLVYLEDGTLVDTVIAPTTWLDITGLTQGTSYTYYVVATDGINTAESNHVTVNTSDTEGPSAESLNLTTSNETTSSIQVDWAKATDNVSAQGDLQYLVYYSTSNNIDTVANIEANGTAFGSYTTDIDTQTITGLTGGTTYYFNVIVIDEAGNKTAYTAASGTTLTLGAPTLSSSDTTATGTTLSWTTVSDATSYSVYLEDGTLVGTVTAPTTWLDITGLTQGTSYTYYVVATDGTNTAESNHITVNTSDTEAPTPTGGGAVTSSNPTYTTLDISWPMATDNVTLQGALVYLAYYSTDSDDLSTIVRMEANGTPIGDYETYSAGFSIAAVALNRTVTGLSSGTAYYFNVIVKDEAGNKAAYSAGSGTTLTPLAVNLSNSDVTETTAILNWNPEPGATLYRIYNGSGALTGTVSAPTVIYLLTGLTPHTTYRYTVVAMDGATVLATSNITEFTTLGGARVPNPQTGDPSRWSEWFGALWNWIF